MLGMVVRAAYLSTAYDLSTWKGGGMGMFASADGADTRFTRIYIEGPSGERHPLVRFSREQQELLRRAIWYPVRENFVPLANSIRASQWASNNMREKVSYYDRNGKFLRSGPESYVLLSAIGLRPPGEETNFAIIIDYFSLSYDVESRSLRSKLV
jgi:hypothetical protein